MLIKGDKMQKVYICQVYELVGVFQKFIVVQKVEILSVVCLINGMGDFILFKFFQY